MIDLRGEGDAGGGVGEAAGGGGGGREGRIHICTVLQKDCTVQY